MQTLKVSLPEAAAALGVKDWQLRRVFLRELTAEADRIGRNRIICEEDLPRLRDALVRAGYLRTT